jgi:hypothetical protein
MCEDINFLFFIIGLILLIFSIYKYKYKKFNNKILNELMTDLPHITRYYL